MDPFLKKLLLWGGLAYVVILCGVFVVCGYGARSRVEKLLDNSVNQIRTELSQGADSIVILIGKTVIGAHNYPEEVTADELKDFMKRLPLDELSIVGKDGRILLSSEPGLVGADFHPEAKTRTVDYSQLLDGRRTFVAEEVRGSVEQPSLRRKYGGVAFPVSRGFVQVGLDEKRVANDFNFFHEKVAVDCRIGESGYFIVANSSHGTIYSTFDAANIGKELNDVTDGLLFTEKSFWKTKRITAFGRPCFARDGICFGYRVLALIPESEAAGMRNAAVAISAVILLVVFVVFGAFMRQADERNRQMALFFENERRQAEKDLMMAKDIQANALPSVFPPYPKLVGRIDLYAAMRTAKEVGGDFYDFYFAGSDRLAIIIADVSGKGVPAALFMMRAKSTLQGLLRGGADVAEAVAETNNRLSSGNEANMFVTAWVGVVDLVSGQVEYVNAGHNPPLVRRADGPMEWLKERSGPPLASFEGMKYRKHALALRPGDGIFLYTDGVTEATDRSLELFGEERLIRSFGPERPQDAAAPRRTSQELCRDLFVELDRFAAGMEQADDITMLAFKLNDIGPMQQSDGNAQAQATEFSSGIVM